MRISRKAVHVIARLGQIAMVLVAAWLILQIVLVVLGRVPLEAYHHGKVIKDATLARPYVAGAATHGLMATMTGRVGLMVDHGRIDGLTRLVVGGVLISGVLPSIPIALMMAKLCGNIAQERIFVPGNARLLMASGYVGIAGAVLATEVAGQVMSRYNHQMGAGIGWNRVPGLLPLLVGNLLFLIVGYIFAYGLQLQRDADGLV